MRGATTVRNSIDTVQDGRTLDDVIQALLFN